VAGRAVLVLGNIAGGRELLQTPDPPHGYDWFAPSRVVPGTINEFPWFSFLLADLHAHVLALPFTLLAAGFSVQVALFGHARGRGCARCWRRWSPRSRSGRCMRSTRGRIR
jgi:uncharacterized membrane protein